MGRLEVQNLDTPIVCYSRVAGLLATIGGPLDRETVLTAPSNNQVYCSNNHAINIDDFCLWQHKARTYKFFPAAQYMVINTLVGTYLGPSTALPNGELVTGGTSGATGRIIETTIGGDTFLKLSAVTGTFVAAEQVLGGTSGATCNVTTPPALRGTPSYQGEWGIAHTTSVALQASNLFTGWFAGLADAETKYAALWGSGSGVINAMEFCPDEAVDDQFVETLSVATGQNYLNTSTGFGRAVSDGETLRLPIGLSSPSNGIRMIEYNIATRSAGVVNGTAGPFSRNHSTSFNLVPWRGKLLCGMIFSSNDDIELREVGGGTMDTVVLKFAGQAAAGATYDFAEGAASRSCYCGSLLILNDELFILMYTKTATVANFGYVMAHVIETAGTFAASNFYADGSTNETSTDAGAMAAFALPSYLDQAAVGASISDNSKFFTVLEQEVNDPTGADKLEIIHKPLISSAVAADVLEFIGLTALTDVTYTFNGTTTVTTSAMSGLGVGAFFGMTSDKRIWEVASVGPTSLTIKNPWGYTIPTGSGAMRELNAFTTTGTITAGSRHVFSHDHLGGGQRSFINDELFIRISSRLPVAGGIRLGLRAFGGVGSTGFAALYYGEPINKPATLQGSLSAPSIGTIVSDENTAFPLDGTENFVTWDAVADGVASGENRRIVAGIRE